MDSPTQHTAANLLLSLADAKQQQKKVSPLCKQTTEQRWLDVNWKGFVDPLITLRKLQKLKDLGFTSHDLALAKYPFLWVKVLERFEEKQAHMIHRSHHRLVDFDARQACLYDEVYVHCPRCSACVQLDTNGRSDDCMCSSVLSHQ